MKESLRTVCYYMLFGLVRIISSTPFKGLYILSDILYYPTYYMIRYRRKIVRRNLIESFPQKSLKELKAIERKFYHFLVDIVLESCKLLTIAPDELKEHIVFSNITLINQKVAEGKSISLFLGHYGNWEWVSTMRLWMCPDTIAAQIFHRLRNKSIDKFMSVLRGRFGHISVDMHQTARFMARVATEGKPCVIGFIADQSPRKKEAKHFLPFLNHRVPVLTGTERVTKHYGYEAIFLRMKRVRRGYYECSFVPLHDNPRTLPDFELTSLYYQQLEQEITEHPEFYLWTHNRFKHAIRP
ncbi:MAG: lysophospholipid acyltransferase family protein [Bacteroidaceae bacterium]